MSYLVLARKYRPLSFQTVNGQEHITRTLGNAIRRDQVHHAYLFAGPRGVGKTSVARIFSKCLECVNGPTVEPCLECSNCLEIAQGKSLAVWEIDGASHNSVENVRELMESFRSLPPPGSRYKIYIIDEVHMLSTAAFNALLKSLEEPPPNTVFILATTEAHKIPETVISRCQRHDFRALSPKTIEECLRSVSREEVISIDDAALRMIARLSDGSMRDAHSLLERVRAFCDERISAREVGEILGTVDQSVLEKLARSILDREVKDALSTLHLAFSSGIDPALFLREFVNYWRDLMLAKFQREGLLSLGASEEYVFELSKSVEAIEGRDLQDLVALAREGCDTALRSNFPQYALESLVVRMATREPVRELGEILSQIKASLRKAHQPVEKPASTRSQPIAPRRSERGGVRTEVGGNLAERPVEVIHPVKSKKVDWDEFVAFARERVTPMMVEHLKRISIEQFIPGRIEGRGPDFTVAHLNLAENRSKLGDLLGEYSGEPKWQIVLRNGEGKTRSEAGSILHREQLAQREEREKRKQEVLEHPTVQSVKQAFPGSIVESVSVKPEGK